MRRVLAVSVLAAVLAAAVASAQLWLAGWARIYFPEQAFHPSDEWYGNPVWPGQLFVVVWCVSSAVVVGAAVAEPLVRQTRWRLVVAVVAGLGSLAAVRLTSEPVTQVATRIDVTAAATRAVLVGAAVGGLVAVPVVCWRGIARWAMVWMAWVWCTAGVAVVTYSHHRPGADHIVPVATFGVDDLWPFASAVVLAPVLGWWGGRRGEPHPVLGAVIGPVLLLTGWLSVRSMESAYVNDHRAQAVLVSAVVLWSLVALVGAALAVVAARIGRRRADQAAGRFRLNPAAAFGALVARVRRSSIPLESHATPSQRAPIRDSALPTRPSSPARTEQSETIEVAAVEPPPSPQRLVLAAGMALAVAACAAAAQLGLGRWLRILVPDQSYDAGNDTWPFQLVLLTWCAACATVIGGVVGASVTGHRRGRYPVALAAMAGAVVPVRVAIDWAAGATSVSGDPGAAAISAFLIGAALGGTLAVTAAVDRPGLRRSAAAWASLVWLSVVIEVAIREAAADWDHVVPVHPLGLITPGWFGTGLGLLPPLALAVLLGWWAARRGERLPAATAVVGALLVTAIHVAVAWLPGGHSSGDHYSLDADRSAWLLVSVLAWAAAAAGARMAHRRAAPSAAPDTRTGAGHGR